MDRASRARWVVLLSALGGTLGAIFYPVDKDDARPVAYHPMARAKVRHAIAALPEVADTEDIDDGDPDPFAPRGWQPLLPSPQPSEPPKQVVAVMPVQPTAPSGPPPLPFRFVGSLTDGADRVVYLGRGQQALAAHVGDVLDNSYKVVSIGSSQMEIEYLPTGQKQDLVFPTRDN